MEKKFTVPGEPTGKGRPRFAKQGNFVRTYTPEKTVSYENLVKLEYERQCAGEPFSKDIPLFMKVEAFYSVPKSASRKKRIEMLGSKIRPTKKPDADNILKIIADSLNGIAYHDDAQIVSCELHKYYGEIPQVNVTIRSEEINQELI